MDAGFLPIMTYGGVIPKGGSHAAEEFYPHRPAGPPLRRRDPSAPPPAPRPRTQVPRRAPAGPVVLCRRAHSPRSRMPASACADAPSHEAAQLALLATLPDFAELQRRLNAALAGDLPQALRRRRQPLAIDLTLIPYHGRPLHDADEIYRCQAKSGTSHFHAYATPMSSAAGCRFTVALTSVQRRRAAGGGRPTAAPSGGRGRRPAAA